ncbi:MAG: lysophospholipid acyltransferase family protein [Chloroflexota bacterium]|nr:lysophospholipid acyltransferase family protein [Chloroflexota bacterium]
MANKRGLIMPLLLSIHAAPTLVTAMQRTPKLTYAVPTDPLLKKVLIHSIEHLTGRGKLEKIYATALQNYNATTSFWEAALAALQIKLVYSEARLAAVPRHAPIIFIANHPFGVLDGLALCHLAAKTGHDFRILVHSALMREESIARYLLPIDFSETAAAMCTNIESKRQALAMLRQGGALVIFPAGAIATTKGPFGKATDLEWKLFTAKLIHMTQATVVPIYFHGQNSRLFQLVSQFSPTLRLSLIISEVNNKVAKAIRITIGQPLPYAQLATIKGRQALMNYLRQATYALAHATDQSM